MYARGFNILPWPVSIRKTALKRVHSGIQGIENVENIYLKNENVRYIRIKCGRNVARHLGSGRNYQNIPTKVRK